MPVGSYMAHVVDRGYLRAGVDQNTLLWGYRDPISGQLEGFDIDMVRRVAIAVFGDDKPSHLHFVVVPNADRVNAVESGEVDIVAETMTITCSREKSVDFSSEYYDAHQEILVPDGSPIHSIATLAGERVCAAAGSTSLTNLESATAGFSARPHLWQVTNQTDCLVMLEQGQVDAVSTDDTILEGLAAQDPHHLHLVAGVTLSDEPYGMAISKSHPEFTRFVNGVLAKERSDGAWAAIWDKWLSATLHTGAPHPPEAVYRG
jgi:polar amino acid transport system substrate-binding protein